MGKIFLLISKHWRKYKKSELFTDIRNYMIIMQNTILRILWHVFLHVMGNEIGAFVGGPSPRPPLRSPFGGGLMGGGFTQTKRLRKELKSILIHNNTLQSFVWSSIALKIHVYHFENWIFFCGFSTKVTRAFLASETMENVLKVHLTCHSVNGGSLEITHLFYLNIVTS